MAKEGPPPKRTRLVSSKKPALIDAGFFVPGIQ